MPSTANHYLKQLGLWLCLLFVCTPVALAAALDSAKLNGVWELSRVDDLDAVGTLPDEGYPVYWLAIAGRDFSLIPAGSQKVVGYGLLDLETGRVRVKGMVSDFVWTFRFDDAGRLISDEFGGAYSTFQKISDDPAFRPEPVVKYAPVTKKPVTAEEPTTVMPSHGIQEPQPK